MISFHFEAAGFLMEKIDDVELPEQSKLIIIDSGRNNQLIMLHI